MVGGGQDRVCGPAPVIGSPPVPQTGPACRALGQGRVLADPGTGPGVRCAWWVRIAARSPSANRPAAAAWPSARSTAALPCSGGELHGSRPSWPGPGRARRGGLGQPQRGAVADRQELGLRGGAGLRRAGPARRAAAAGSGASSTRGLPGVVTWWRATSAGRPARHGRSTTCSPCRRTHTACPASWCGTEYWPPSKDTIDSSSAVRVTPSAAVNGTTGTGCSRGLFLGQHLGRSPAGDPVRPGVHLLAEHRAGLLQPGERAVLRQQVGVSRHQVGLGDLHRGFRPAFRRRVIRHAGRHGQPVMPPQRDRGRVTDRQPGDMLDRHRLLVIGQQVSRHPAGPAQRGIDRAGHRRPGLIQQRQHHPEPGPGHPQQNKIVATPSIRGPSPKSYCAHIPGSGIHGRYTRRRPAAYAPLIPATARRVVRSDPAYPIAVIISCATSARIFPSTARLSPPASPGTDQSRSPGAPARRPARAALLALTHIPCDCVMGAARQLGGIPQRPCQVVSLKNVHDLLGRLHSSPPRGPAE